MTSELAALCFDANDPAGVARFWGGVLDRQRAVVRDYGTTLLPDDDTGFQIRFLLSRQQKAGPNQIHLDLTSTSLEDQQRTVATALELGGRLIDIGQGPDAAHVVLADRSGQLRRLAGGRLLLE
jgi:hypothetical protein